jgi:hypothetical protein
MKPMNKTEFTGKLSNWGKQTILHAMSLKAQVDRRPLDTPKKVINASAKAEETLTWIWEDVVKETGGNATLFCTRFTEMVLDWTWYHRKGRPNAVSATESA